MAKKKKTDRILYPAHIFQGLFIIIIAPLAAIGLILFAICSWCADEPHLWNFDAKKQKTLTREDVKRIEEEAWAAGYAAREEKE